jgi:hypothetical protein
MKKTILFIMSMLLIAAALFSLSACDIFYDSKCKHDDAGESCLYCGVTDEKYFTFTLLEDGTYSVKAKDRNNMPSLVIIPDTYKGAKVTSIPDQAFIWCDKITGVKIGDNVVTIGAAAFAHCRDLTDLVLGKSITSIEGAAFDDCDSKLFSGYDNLLYVRSLDNPYAILIDTVIFQKHHTEYEIHEDTEFIAAGAMEGCTEVTELTIPKKVVSIGRNAFSFCQSLETVNILSNKITYIGRMAFYCCSDLSEITIPRKVKYIGEQAFASCNLDSIKGGNLDYPVIGNCLIERKTKTLMAGSNSSVIPYGVTSIANGAFSYRNEMTGIKIPKSVTYIGERAFSICKSLESIEIPDSVTTIGGLAFDGCESLRRVIIGKNVSSIGVRAFVCCQSLTDIEVDSRNEHFKSIDGSLYTKDGKTIIQYATGRKDATFVIPDGVTTIGEAAFATCENLESIVIPKSVKKIESPAFSYKLINIYYRGNEFQWDMIDINPDLEYINIYYNYTP